MCAMPLTRLSRPELLLSLFLPLLLPAYRPSWWLVLIDGGGRLLAIFLLVNRSEAVLVVFVWRGAVRCGAVPCGTMRCGLLLCCYCTDTSVVGVLWPLW